MGDRTDNWEELVQSQENRLYRAALAACCVLVLGAGQLLSDGPFIRGVFAASPSESGTSSGLEPSPGGGGQGDLPRILCRGRPGPLRGREGVVPLEVRRT